MKLLQTWETSQMHEIRERTEKTKVNTFFILYNHSVVMEPFS